MSSICEGHTDTQCPGGFTSFMQDGTRPLRTAAIFYFLQHFDALVIALHHMNRTGAGMDWAPQAVFESL